MAMYEHSETPLLRRIWWVIPGVIMLGLLIWLLTWLIFFHHPASKKSPVAPKSPTTQGHSPAPSASTPNSGTNTTPVAPNSTTNNQPSSAPTTPSELANTGPGDVMLPAMAATVVGGGLYYLRLRRRVSEEQ